MSSHLQIVNRAPPCNHDPCVISHRASGFLGLGRTSNGVHTIGLMKQTIIKPTALYVRNEAAVTVHAVPFPQRIPSLRSPGYHKLLVHGMSRYLLCFKAPVSPSTRGREQWIFRSEGPPTARYPPSTSPSSPAIDDVQLDLVPARAGGQVIAEDTVHVQLHAMQHADISQGPKMIDWPPEDPRISNPEWHCRKSQSNDLRGETRHMGMHVNGSLQGRRGMVVSTMSSPQFRPPD
ncbi:uncharacterized protein ARMOST_00127 [Armillaria ostoyae]|uniref:Uncharacterized protein n=1 Tax=Armillaria ostoyae TaxID=47428 RepID=A0A284QKB1_ARMOS|nr:uncharacterized protein ARMOST_00127 [Armillaria ostoyae]